MDNNRLELPIREALEKGHSIALSTDRIPQTTKRADLEGFNRLLQAAKQRMKLAYNYDLHLLYNEKKMVVLRTINEIAIANKMFIFARNFHVNRLKEKFEGYPASHDCIVFVPPKQYHRWMVSSAAQNYARMFRFNIGLLSRDSPSRDPVDDYDDGGKEASSQPKGRLAPRSTRGFNELLMMLLD